MEHILLPTMNTHSPPAVTREVRLRPGEILNQAGSPLVGVVRIESGRLKRYRVYGGREFLAGIAGPGVTLGLDDFLLGGVSRETLQAVGETVLHIERSEHVETWLAGLPTAFIQMLRGSLSEVRPEAFLKRPLDLLPVRARVAATLWLLAAQHASGVPRQLDLSLTREEIAHLAGTVYESVIRTLTALKAEGVIALDGRVIRILDEDRLAGIGQIVIRDRND